MAAKSPPGPSPMTTRSSRTRTTTLPSSPSPSPSTPVHTPPSSGKASSSEKTVSSTKSKEKSDPSALNLSKDPVDTATFPTQADQKALEKLNLPPSIFPLPLGDSRDRVFLAVIRTLLVLENEPCSTRDLTNHILKHGYTTLGGSTPAATVSSRISQHYSRAIKDSRSPILERVYTGADRSSRHIKYRLAHRTDLVATPARIQHKSSAHTASSTNSIRRPVPSVPSQGPSTTPSGPLVPRRTTRVKRPSSRQGKRKKVGAGWATRPSRRQLREEDVEEDSTSVPQRATSPVDDDTDWEEEEEGEEEDMHRVKKSSRDHEHLIPSSIGPRKRRRRDDNENEDETETETEIEDYKDHPILVRPRKSSPPPPSSAHHPKSSTHPSQQQQRHLTVPRPIPMPRKSYSFDSVSSVTSADLPYMEELDNLNDVPSSSSSSSQEPRTSTIKAPHSRDDEEEDGVNGHPSWSFSSSPSPILAQSPGIPVPGLVHEMGSDGVDEEFFSACLPPRAWIRPMMIPGLASLSQLLTSPLPSLPPTELEYCRAYSDDEEDEEHLEEAKRFPHYSSYSPSLPLLPRLPGDDSSTLSSPTKQFPRPFRAHPTPFHYPALPGKSDQLLFEEVGNPEETELTQVDQWFEEDLAHRQRDIKKDDNNEGDEEREKREDDNVLAFATTSPRLIPTAISPSSFASSSRSYEEDESPRHLRRDKGKGAEEEGGRVTPTPSGSILIQPGLVSPPPDTLFHFDPKKEEGENDFSGENKGIKNGGSQSSKKDHSSGASSNVGSSSYHRLLSLFPSISGPIDQLYPGRIL
ncbi:hypothetical protein BJ684DRAFT_14399 [Piptocephalis cylindrospora]|uniref:GDS1 winged helix domain-containing protein n=1 Tax=Piptocephalis cylindrospora TaxID=1907219 RepID=A0A4P9Y950_9FUNG|nr:hypothetical protein BJ684DRAFT_14399 [Piptocephalis cylindrospora]|eukprot:RKP15354.1 hypothetical protein BJ684DRAFT_14399 [Piptocephalis cylindrospora]